MKTLPDGLAAHIGEPVTTLAQAWRVTLTDGRMLGFTDHDEPLDFAGTRFDASTGFAASAAETALGLAASTREVEGALSSEGIREEDVAAGLFDGAKVETFVVNWQKPEDFAPMEVCRIGEVRRGETGYTAELRGPEAELDRPRGRIYRRRCDAVFGDTRCGMPASDVPYRIEANIVEGAENVIVLENVADPNAFVGGRARLLSGAGAGRSAEITAAPTTGLGGTRLHLTEPIASGVVAGDRMALIVGCDRSFATCRDRFANSANFRGFPHMPGSDAGLAVAKPGAVHNGRPLVP